MRARGYASTSSGPVRTLLADVPLDPERVARDDRRARLAELSALIETLSAGGAAGL